MPRARFALLVAAVILAAALTISVAMLASGIGAAGFAWLLPLAMAVALAVRAVGRR